MHFAQNFKIISTTLSVFWLLQKMDICLFIKSYFRTLKNSGNSKVFVTFFPARCKIVQRQFNSLHLARKYAPIIICSWEAHSFPRASRSENCKFLGTHRVGGQTFVHFSFAPDEAIFYISSVSSAVANSSASRSKFEILRSAVELPHFVSKRKITGNKALLRMVLSILWQTWIRRIQRSLIDVCVSNKGKWV